MIIVYSLFWFSIGFLIYINFGYFFSLFVITRFYKRKVRECLGQYHPSVTVLIPAFNEEKVIREKIQSTLDQDYPGNKLQILVGSDDSADKTNQMVEEFSAKGVKLIIIKPRLGKTNVLNNLVKYATGEILVFTDANAFFKDNAISCLVRPFCDEAVGCVFGKVLSLASDDTPTGFGGGLYWVMEERLKSYESMIGSSIGATGAIFALRKELYEQYPIEAIPDFVPSLAVIKKGYRIIDKSDAIAYEKLAKSGSEELLRKRRIVSRSIKGMLYLKDLLNPLKYPITAFQIISHKVLRWIGFLFILTALATNAVLAVAFGGIWFYLLVVQVLLYLAALAGYIFEKLNCHVRLFAIPYYFFLANVGAFLGVIDFFAGKVPVVWDSAKSSR